jgi:hypothetical protein
MKRVKKVLQTPLLLLAGFSVSLLAPLLLSSSALAGTVATCNWTSQVIVDCGNPLGGFIQTNTSGNDMTFELQAYHEGQTTCDIQLDINPYPTSKTGKLTVAAPLGCPSPYNIRGQTYQVAITNPPGKGPGPGPGPGISCTWVYQGELKCGNITFDLSATSVNQVTLTESSTSPGEPCPSQIIVANFPTAKAGVEHSASGLACVRNSLAPVTITNTWDSAKPPPGSGNSSTPDISMVCTVSIFNPLTWLFCPLVSGAQSAIEGLTSGIDSLLTVNTCTLFSVNESCNNSPTVQDKKTSTGFYQAWNTFRILAAGIIVVAGLAMLIAQAVGTSAIDAYTIHKVLPRILIAVIFITLSWPLLNFAITLSNDVGIGIRAIIYTPFEHIGNTVTIGGGATTVGAIVGTATFLTLGLLGVASFMLTALLAVFIGFLVLFLRQVIIMMLVIFAPLAIACYVLPGTQKAWGFWKDTFLSMLIIFPIISAMIAMGRVFAVVLYNTANTGSSPGFINEIGAFIVYFLPYFLIPMAFKWAGGAMATVGGLMSDRGKGAFDKLKSFRQGKAASNLQGMKEGRRFKSDNIFAKSFNATTFGAANLHTAGFNPAKMRSRMQQGRSLSRENALGEYMEKSAAFRSYKNNDDYLQATMKNMGGGENEADWRRYLSAHGYEGRALEQGVATIRAARRDASGDVFKQASVIANASTGTGWKDGGVPEMMESINQAAGGDRHTAINMLAQMRGAASQSGRLDLAGSSFGLQAGQLNRMYDEAAANGGQVSDTTKLDVKQKLHGSILETKGANEFSRARGQAVEQLAPEMLRELKQAHANLDATEVGTAERTQAHRDLAQKYASLANFHDSLNHMSPENAKLVADGVLSQKIGDETVMEHIETYRRTQNADFLSSRHDYDAKQYR